MWRFGLQQTDYVFLLADKQGWASQSAWEVVVLGRHLEPLCEEHVKPMTWLNEFSFICLACKTVWGITALPPGLKKCKTALLVSKTSCFFLNTFPPTCFFWIDLPRHRRTFCLAYTSHSFLKEAPCLSATLVHPRTGETKRSRGGAKHSTQRKWLIANSEEGENSLYIFILF